VNDYPNHDAMKLFLSIVTTIIVGYSTSAQDLDFSALFSDDQPLDIRLKLSIKEVRKETNDTTYMKGVMLYQETAETWDSIPVKIRTRGDFRLQECYFPPLRIKIKKSNAKGTLFEGNKALKLVVPCNKGGDNNGLIVREYLCYKLYEAITPYTFSTRLVNIDFWDTTGKKSRNYSLTGFFIEDDDIVAERFNASIKKGLTLHPLALHDTSAIRHDLFQYMISNIDWSTTYMHNEKIMLTEDPLRYIPLTYDFDMSGLVNAPYAVVNPDFDMDNVRDRVFRGFCRKDNQVLEYVRAQFVQQEETMHEIIANYQGSMVEKDYKKLMKFIEEFFVVMKSDKLFRQEILNKCRNE